MTTYTDAFTSTTEEALGGSWANLTGAVRKASNRAIPLANGDNQSYYNDAFGDDQIVSVKVYGLTAAKYAGPSVRCSAAGGRNQYWAFATSSAVGLQKFVNGSYTDLGSTSATVADGDTIELRVTGSSLQVYHNTALVTGLGSSGTVTDSTLTTGKPGLGFYSGSGYETMQMDDWSATDSASSTPLAAFSAAYRQQ